MGAAEALDAALRLAAIPCISMLIMSALVFVIEVPKTVVRCFQHLAAGIVLSAVAVELVPIISEAPNDMPNILGIVGGFTVGVTVMTWNMPLTILLKIRQHSHRLGLEGRQ